MIGGRSWYVAKKAKQPVAGEGADHESPRHEAGRRRQKGHPTRSWAGAGQSQARRLTEALILDPGSPAVDARLFLGRDLAGRGGGLANFRGGDANGFGGVWKWSASDLTTR